MKFMFTRSKRISSRLIRWALEEPVSHFAIGFDCRPNGYGVVIHSYMTGVHIVWYKNFLETNEVVFELEPTSEMSLEDEEKIYQSLVNSSYGKAYDRLAFAYFGLRAVAKKMLGWSMPRGNAWEVSNKYLCTELYGQLAKANDKMFPELSKDPAISSPMDIYLSMSKSKALTHPAKKITI